MAAAAGLAVCGALAAGCNDGKTIVPPGFDLPDARTGDGTGTPDALPDGRIPPGPDILPDGTVLPDGTILPDGAILPDSSLGPDSDTAVIPDGTSLPDGLGQDLTPDADGGSWVPFAPCTKTEPKCSSQDEICLLLPNSDEGLCLLDCSGGELCPPWMQCVPPDKQKPELKVCLELGPKMSWCNNKKGRICQGTLSCLFPPGAEDGVCTTFCNLGDEAGCPEGAVCTVIDLQDPEVDWGACLTAPDLPECKEAAECQAGSTCVQLKQTFRCAPKCADVDGPCGLFGTCVMAEMVDMAQTPVCLTFQKAGEICSTAKGMPCAGELICADVGAADGWSRCVQACADGPCAPGFVCKAVASLGFDACLPMELALGPFVPCNDGWPCKEAGQACFKSQGMTSGICIAGCGEGCPGGTTCQGDACVTVVAEGGGCLESAAVVCQLPAQCVRDKGATGIGMCLNPCVPGQPCGAGKNCLETSVGQSYCLVPGEYAQLCSLDDGIGCNSAAGLTCLHVAAEADYGFCAPECEGPGDCPPGPTGSLSECMLKSGGKWYCAFLCGGMGGKCPEGMGCSGIGVCTP
jgi:hypothetical protein